MSSSADMFLVSIHWLYESEKPFHFTKYCCLFFLLLVTTLSSIIFSISKLSLSVSSSSPGSTCCITFELSSDFEVVSVLSNCVSFVESCSEVILDASKTCDEEGSTPVVVKGK